MADNNTEFTPKGEFKLLMKMFDEFKTDVSKSLAELKDLFSGNLAVHEECNNKFQLKEHFDKDAEIAFNKLMDKRTKRKGINATLTYYIIQITAYIAGVIFVLYRILTETGVIK